MAWVITSLLCLAPVAAAHDRWANGDAVPAWVKQNCCGSDHAHHVQRGDVEQKPDGWHVKGFRGVIPYGRELPSADGEYWIFYKDFSDGSQSQMFCFFAPPQGL